MKLWLVKASVNSPSDARTAPLHRAKTVKRFVRQDETKTLTVARRDKRTRARECHLDAQSKVPVIMDDGNLRKQAYQGTGCQRGSRGRG
jgi:hypothetical protein